MQLIESAIAQGYWRASIATDAPDPVIELWHKGAQLAVLAPTPMAGQAGQVQVEFAIPAALLNDGVQTIVVQTGDGTQIGNFSILMGSALEQDLRAELDLMRAELDLLKKAFRRHCAEN